MRAADIAPLLRKHNMRVFTTRDLASLSGLLPGTASQHLIRLARAGAVTRIKRAQWVNLLADGLNPYETVPYLVAPWPAYVSLHSALSEHGIVEEIPQVVYAVTPAMPRRCATPIGNVHFHHLPERLIWGYSIQHTGAASYPMAEPEKAFLDLCYLALSLRSPLGFPRRRSRRWNLDHRKISGYAARFKCPPLLEYLKKEKLIRA